MTECSCPEWQENIPQINSAFFFLQNHGMGGYSGKPFVVCPWCGTKLEEATK